MRNLNTKYYKLGEVAKILGLSKKTIIRYEQGKIFPPPRRNSINGWREYTLKEIKKMQEILGRI